MIQNVTIASHRDPDEQRGDRGGEEKTGHDEERQRDPDAEAEQTDPSHDDADSQSLPACGPAPEPVQRRRRDERDRREDREQQRRAVQAAVEVVELTEALRERHGEQERDEHLHARQDDANFLQQAVVAIAKLGAIALVIEILGRDLAVFRDPCCRF